MQYRALLFCHDGTALGHLRRICRIAGALQGPFAALVATGAREASWLVPPNVDFVKLPSLEGIMAARARRAGRARWLDDQDAGIAFRNDMLRSLVSDFRPDLIVIDYLPFGQNDELVAPLAESDAVKYFIHRGIADAADADVLHGADDIARTYDRILVAADPTLCDVATEDHYGQAARAKLAYVGYVTDRPQIAATHDDSLIVCSGGGGRRSEPLLLQCIAAARHFTDKKFCVVFGPRSSVDIASLGPLPVNCEVFDRREDLDVLHGQAALVISTGGYNSTIEAARGGARLIVCPNQQGSEDEQLKFAERLGNVHPVRLITDPSELIDAIAGELGEAAIHQRQQPELMFGGAERVTDLALADLAARSAQTVSWLAAQESRVG